MRHAVQRDAEIAAEFVHQNVDIIVAFGAAVPALKRATSVIPTSLLWRRIQ